MANKEGWTEVKGDVPKEEQPPIVKSLEGKPGLAKAMLEKLSSVELNEMSSVLATGGIIEDWCGKVTDEAVIGQIIGEMKAYSAEKPFGGDGKINPKRREMGKKICRLIDSNME
jgi:hypothetical protein